MGISHFGGCFPDRSVSGVFGRGSFEYAVIGPRTENWLYYIAKNRSVYLSLGRGSQENLNYPLD